VIIVDCDLRRPTLHEYYGVNTNEGLTTALVGVRDPLEMLRQTGTPGIRLLPAGPLMPVPASVLAGTKGMDHVLSRLVGAADYVLVDTSPVTIGADTSAIAASVDATVMVVDLETARRDVLAAAVEQLRAARANIVGVVVNRAETLLRDHAYRGYYGRSGRSLFAEESGSNATQPAPPASTQPPADVSYEDELRLRGEEAKRASGSQR
jgi:capsular exopolysaccharide synthesis family protein